MWRAVHPPKRGRWLAFTMPYVHRGFLRCWTSNGLNTRVVERVQQLIAESRDLGRHLKIYVTGHNTFSHTIQTSGPVTA